MLRVRLDQVVECDTPEEALSYLHSLNSTAGTVSGAGKQQKKQRIKANKPAKCKPGDPGWSTYLWYITRKRGKKEGRTDLLKLRSEISREMKEKYAK